jgi:hypothetical protein
MVYWVADALSGGEVEQAYSAWEGHQRGYHDWIELGDRVAEALAGYDPCEEVTAHAVQVQGPSPTHVRPPSEDRAAMGEGVGQQASDPQPPQAGTSLEVTDAVA